jgi:hypothetical protein
MGRTAAQKMQKNVPKTENSHAAPLDGGVVDIEKTFEKSLDVTK